MEEENNAKEKPSPLLGTIILRRFKQCLGRMIIPHLPVNRHVFGHLRWELRAFWVRANNRFNPAYIYKRMLLAKGNGLSVNIASGGNTTPGWINLDLMPHNKRLFLRYDCRKKLPFKAGSVARIRCEHFFEHLDFQEEAPFFLQSCCQSLQEGGVLRLVVPDAGRFLAAYQSGKKEDWLALGWNLDNLPEGFSTQMDIINYVFRQGEEHMYAYDFETISLLLRRAGFVQIQKYEFGISADPKLRDDGHKNKLHSLYVEAVK